MLNHSNPGLSRPMSAVWAAVVLAAGCNGPETEFRDVTPSMGVAPLILDYGEVVSPTASTADLYISNNGRAALEVDLSIEQPGGDRAFSIEGERSLTIAAGDSTTIPVVFQPSTFLDYAGTLVIESNDPDVELLQVPLTGVGVDGPVPDIDVQPLTLDFATVAQGAQGVQPLRIDNLGGADLNLGSLVQSGSGAFRIDPDPSRWTVAGGSAVTALVYYEPTQEAGDNGSLVIRSDDPDEPEVTVVLLGNGGGDFEYPEAVVDCPQTSGPPEWVRVDGSASTDPGGQPLFYEWSLVSRPAGSQAEFRNDSDPATDLFTDVAGDYEVQLVVTNPQLTRSAPARCLIEAIPEDDLHIELSWDTPSADLDLHVARNGAELFGGNDDCNYCNSNPSWPTAGTDDDPRLDLDDKGGYGPENINIRTPDSGDYTVRVHYFDDHGDNAVTATVRVYSYGVLEYEGNRVLTYNEVWDVGEVNWPAGSFGVLSNPSYAATRRTCNP